VDIASLLGLLLALAGILVGHTLDGGKFSSLVQPAAFAIVVVGTFGAVLLQTKEIRLHPRPAHAALGVRAAARPPPGAGARDPPVEPVGAARRLLSLEQYMAKADPFIQKGLRLVVDGINPDKLRSLLETDINTYEMRERQAARIWESAAGYAPTVGILGAVLGLIHVMENLSDPSRLGAGIAVAFVSTVYGVGLANLLFHPVGNKMKGIVADRVMQYEILTDVFHDIATGDYTRVLEERIACLTAHH
jgi:chemotaxis protein MotA